MIRAPRLVLRIYLIGLAQVAALAFALWITRPEPPHHHPPPPAGHPPPPAPSASRAAVPIALALGLVGISAVLTAMWLATPLARLSQAARSLGAGQLATRTGIRRSDELGDVAVAFDEMAARVEQLVKAQRELLANVSHELRTPLARIRVALDIAEESGQPELAGVAGDLAEIERLVEDILTTARLEGSSAAPPLRLEQVDASVLLDDAAGRFAIHHAGRELRVSYPDAGTFVAIDRVLLRRALDNLLDNGARHSEKPVELVGRRNGEMLEVDVIDRGEGISPEDLAQLFTPFFRADRSRTRHTGGLGLGLVLARRIVEAHGGTLTLESEPGKGTKALLRVPVLA